ncbi:MAG: glycosyltransferase family 4 protein [Methylotenera sp.]
MEKNCLENILMQKSPMKILIVSQYFWPENFRINDLASYFSEAGHEVTVLTGKPNYPEGVLHHEFSVNRNQFSRLGNAEVYRVPMVLRGKRKILLALNYLSFFISASTIGLWKIRHKSFDVIFVFGASPITAAIPAIIFKKIRKVPVFLWVLDLWPESLSATGVVQSDFVLKTVGRMVSWIYENCDYILIQSRSFLESIQKYCATADQLGKVVYFPSWAEEVFGQESQIVQNAVTRRTDMFTVMFAGNIGDAQDFPALLAAAELLKTNHKIRWVIVGDGRARDWVASEVVRRGLSECFHLAGRYPLESMPAFFSCADVLLVSLKTNDIFSRTIPGKVQSYLAFGKPIVGMIDGEAHAVIKESGAGRACGSGDSKGLAGIIEELANEQPEALANMGELGRQYYEKHYDRKMLFLKLENFFKTAVSRKIFSDSV